MNKILIPTDFSAAAESALEFAMYFLEKRDEVMITVLHSAQDTPVEGEEQSMREKFREIQTKYKDRDLKAILKFQLVSGELTKAILDFHKADGTDLIVMGTKGSGDENIPTNTADLVLSADCPVLVVPEENRNYTIQNIALALGRNEIDDSFALSMLHYVARKFGAKVHILTIMNDKVPEQGAKSNEDVLEYYLDTIDYQHSFPENTDIEEGISDYIEKFKIDMLAILPRNHARKSKPSEGRLTKLLTMRAKVPLLTLD